MNHQHLNWNDLLQINGKMICVPNQIIVPLSLDDQARRLFYTRTLKRSGKYSLLQYENEKPFWSGKGILNYSCGYFPRWVESGYEVSNQIMPNRHWRKRGYPELMEWERK